MDSKSIIRYISESKKRTPVRAYIALDCSERDYDSTDWSNVFSGCRVFDCGRTLIVFGDLYDVRRGLEWQQCFSNFEIETLARNSALPLLDIEKVNARIEPGALIREKAEIGANAVIMMGAVVNIGASIGPRTMIDMGAVLGGRARVGADCHVGAGAVIAGTIEPESAVPTVIEDNVFVGANAVVIEGVRIGANSVIGAGAVVIRDVPPNSVVVGVPGRIIKKANKDSAEKVKLTPGLREL